MKITIDTSEADRRAKRWRRKARQCFTLRHGPGSWEKQRDRAIELARDIYRTMDSDKYYGRVDDRGQDTR